MLDATQLAQKIGKRVLFIGAQAYGWSVQDFAKAAKNARAMGFDTIAPKRADGGLRWYQTPGHMALERQACLSVGCGYLPFMYCYGPRLGTNQIGYEVAVAKEIMAVCDGLVCMDLEVEWNGQDGAAQELARQLEGHGGDIILSTWADPVQQDWMGVISALHPVVSAWGPQQYTNWLGLQEGQFTHAGIPSLSIFPELDISEFFGGANDPLTLLHTALNKGHGSLWFWEYYGALNNPQLTKMLMGLLGTQPVPSTPPFPNHGKNQKWGTIVVQEGDTLTSIAASLHLTNWFHDLYLLNKSTLDNAARVHGAADSQNGGLIYAGTTLRYMEVS